LKKILIVRFSSIGDIVLTSPVIRCLKNQVEGTELHFLTKTAFKSIVTNNPNISKVYSIDNSVAEIIEQLKAENYDLVIDLHKNLRSYFVRMRLGSKSISFDKLNFEKWLVVNFKWNILPPKHIIDRYFDSLQPFGITNDMKGLDFFIPEEEEININSLLVTHQRGYVGIVIGAQHATKRYPAHKLISLCKQLNQPIVLLGGKEDAERAEEIKNSVGEYVFNACGKYSLAGSASLVKQAAWIISNDTGLMHIAAAFKKNIVSLWGNTIPDFGMYPYLAGEKSKIFEVKGLKCRPCSKLGYPQCPLKHFKCMNDIGEGEIVKTIS